MQSFSYLGALLAVGSLLAAPAAAQDRSFVRNVAVRNGATAIEIEIHTSGAAVSPNTQAITGPDRIVVDFPGALPSSELRALRVNRGPLKGIRSGLFFNDPPITRIVLDLLEPQAYQIVPIPNGVVVRLGPASAETNVASAPLSAPTIGGAHLTSVAKVSEHLAVAEAGAALRSAVSAVSQIPPPPPEPPKPAVNVTFQNGLLRIRTEGGTLAEVLFEVQRQTQAEIAIPAGAEQEQVVADLGPAPARDVLASLLNGSSYNFIFIDGEQGRGLEKVVLTRREPSF
ncbi:MAG: AMIN domain-containing protein [Acidobacteriia bacterium]|nr:AMIN domain-containing protein [Terriglobia bacterium]